ncbi:MAG: hypothetical protein PUE72_01280 [Lachnospiraceae bacterium]|nr:hypothetical protein [Lachnospiraceae bacterium]
MEEDGCLKGRQMTRKKMCRILRWARNRKLPLKIKKEYNDSMGYSRLREYYGIIKDFTITEYEGNFKLKILFTSGETAEEYLTSWYEFMGKYNPERLVLYYTASGPICYFSMRQLTREEQKERLGQVTQ